MIQADANELLIVARTALLDKVLPLVDGDTSYQVRMIANAMGIAAREMHEAASLVSQERSALVRLLGAESGEGYIEGQKRRLCELIASGVFDGEQESQRLLEALRLVTKAKLRISNPKLVETAR